MAKKLLDPIHPGEILNEDLLKPMGISKYRLAKETGMPADRIGKIISGQRSITADTALRLAAFFRMTPQFWMNAQAHYDLEVARRQMAKQVPAAKIASPRAESPRRRKSA